jgi:hypothetical protein
MKKVPPEWIFVSSGGKWTRSKAPAGVPVANQYQRQISGGSAAFVTPEMAVNPNGRDRMPVSKAAPRIGKVDMATGKFIPAGKPVTENGRTVYQTKDGIRTNKLGQPIVDSTRAAKEVMKKTGMGWD